MVRVVPADDPRPVSPAAPSPEATVRALPDRERVLAAAHEVATTMLAGGSLAGALRQTAAHARWLTSADLALVAVPAADGRLVVEAADGDRAGEFVGLALLRAGPPSGLDFDPGLASGLDFDPGPAAGDGADGPTADLLRTFATASSVRVSLAAGEHPGGVLTVARRSGGQFNPGEERVAALFAAHVSSVLDCARTRLAAQRLAEVEMQERIGAVLNDAVIRPLFQAGLFLCAARPHLDASEAAERLDHAVDRLDAAILGLRAWLFETMETRQPPRPPGPERA
jgi:hypothetical protein